MLIKSGCPDRTDSRHSYKAVFRREEGKTVGGSASGKRDETAWRSSKGHFFFVAALILLLSIVISACAEPEQAVEPAEDQTEAEVSLPDEEEPAAQEVDDPIRDFLCSGEVLSTSDAIGAGYPELYYFSPGGTFAYQTDQYGVRAEGQLISQRGEWSLEGDRLNLTILYEIRAYGGEISEDHFLGEVLSGYELIRSDEVYEVSYLVTLEEDESGRPYLTWDGEEIYMLFIPEQSFEELRFLAERGNGDPGLAVLEERGNSAGNVINYGWIMKSGNWAYLTLLTIHPEMGYVTPLYRVDTDEEGWFAEPEWDRFLMLDEDATGLNMHGGWIYYLNWLDDHRIYRIRPDGSERTPY